MGVDNLWSQTLLYWVPQNSRNNSMGQCQLMLENNEKNNKKILYLLNLKIWGLKRCAALISFILNIKKILTTHRVIHERGISEFLFVATHYTHCNNILIITEPTMALSPVSLTLKQKILVNSKKLFLQ
jgi:hypothetical protein